MYATEEELQRAVRRFCLRYWRSIHDLINEVVGMDTRVVVPTVRETLRWPGAGARA
jgi:hypothetical protein